MHDKLGAGGNRQYALDTITSTYVAFVDSDDIVYPRYAEVLLRGIKTIKGNVLATGIKRELPDGAFVDILPSSQTRSCLTWLHGKVYLVEFLRSKNIRFDSDLRVDEDGLFNSMVALYNPVKGVDEITYLWRYNTSSLTVRKDRIEDNLVSSIMSIAKTIVETYMRDKSKITDTFIVTKVTMLYNVYEEALLRGLTISDRIRPYIVAIDKVIDIVALVNEHPELFGGIQQLGTVDGKSVWYKESLLEFIKHMEVRDNEGIR